MNGPAIDAGKLSLRGQILKFGLVGAVNTAITAFTILVLTLAGVPIVPSNAIGFLLGLVNSFYMNRRFTFGTSSENNVIPFVLSFGFSYALNLAVVLWIDSSTSYNAVIPQFAGMIVYNISFFVLMKAWVFAGDPNPK